MIYDILIGILAGWLVNKYYRGTNPGLISNLLLGVLGSIVGGWVAGLLGFQYRDSLVPKLLVASGGAVLLLWLRTRWLANNKKN